MQCRLLENARCLWDLPKFKLGIRFLLFLFVFFFLLLHVCWEFGKSFV